MSHYLIRSGVKLDELTPDEAAGINLADVTALRAEWFPRAVETIEPGELISIPTALGGEGGNDRPAVSCGAALREWAKRMEAQTGKPRVTVWQTEVPWLAALAVVIYGEAPVKVEGGQYVRQWPDEWRLSDVQRALTWESGAKVPGAVSGRMIIGAMGSSLVSADLTTASAGT